MSHDPEQARNEGAVQRPDRLIRAGQRSNVQMTMAASGAVSVGSNPTGGTHVISRDIGMTPNPRQGPGFFCRRGVRGGGPGGWPVGW
jgi:hypothetical protein